MRMLQAVRSPNGEHIYTAHSSLSIVMDLNLLTNELSHFPIPVAGEFGSVTGVAVAPNGQFVYASHLDGDHWRFESPQADKTIDELAFSSNIVKLSSATGEIVSTLTIPATVSAVGDLPGNPPTGSGDRVGPVWGLSVSADGTVGSTSFRRQPGRVLLIDLDAMTLLGDFDVSSDIQDIRHTAVSPDKNFIYIGGHRNSGGLWVLEVASGDVTNIDTRNTRTQGLQFDDAGDLYWAARNSGADDLTIFTFTSADYSAPTANTAFAYTGTPTGLDLEPYGDFYYICTRDNQIIKVDKATNTEVYAASVPAQSRHACVTSAY